MTKSRYITASSRQKAQKLSFAAAVVAALIGITAVVYLMVTPSIVQPIMLELVGDLLRLMLAACAASVLIGALVVRS